jgi:peptide/nickel transport system substrate-binding protein
LEKRRSILAVLVIVIVVVALVGGSYYYTMLSSKVTTTKSLPTSMVAEEYDQPDTVDPATVDTTQGWEIIDQVYQGLIAPNLSSVTTYVGQLARNWTVSPDGMNYTFYLRQNVTFSNGDSFNSYDIWFSFYRSIIMDQDNYWYLGQNLGLSNGAGFNVTDEMLNSINYVNPSPQNLTVMEYPDQSVQVVNPYEVILNLGYGYNGDVPYSAFLATLTTVCGVALDPKVVEAHGGVVAGQPNPWMNTHAVGTGFYELGSWIQGQSLTLVKNPNYWGNNVPLSELNYAIQPAILDTIFIYYKPVGAMISDLKSGFAQMTWLPVSQYGVVKQIPGLDVSILPIIYGSSGGEFFVYMDPYAFPPFQNLLVREAIAYAIDYKSIIHSVFNDLAIQYIGPIPPGFPYYSESTVGLQPYQYDAVKAATLLAQAGYRSKLPNGTELNAAGQQFPSVNFLYDADDYTQGLVASVILNELGSIGINIALTPMMSREWNSVLWGTNVNSTTYPFGISYYSEDYMASIDFVSALTLYGYVGASGYSNQTVIGWQTAAATALDNSTIIQNFQMITRAMYYDYTDIWLYVADFMTVHASNISGIILNPFGSCVGSMMYYNTIYYTS